MIISCSLNDVMKRNILLLSLTIVATLSAKSQTGSLDNSFGGTGRVVLPIGNFDDRAEAIAIQTDGKIIVVGQTGLSASNPSLFGDHNFSVCRLNSDGTLDNTFDGDGKVLIPTGDFAGLGTSLAIQADGKILVAGRGFYNATAEDFTIARLNTDGSLDNSFDGDGIAAIPIGFTDDVCYSVALQTDGKIVLAGQSYSDDVSFFGYGFSVVRLNTNGSLDNSFDNDGKKFIKVSNSLNSAAFDVALQGDGKIVLAGVSRNDASPSIWYTTVVRLLPDGSFDTGFDSDGQVTLITAGRSECYAVFIQPDEKILLAGMERDPSTFIGGFSIIRLMPNGLPDNSFGSNGKVIVFLGQETDRAHDIVVQPNGKIVVVGSYDTGKGFFFGAIRLTSAGALDNSFDGDGKVLLNFPDEGRSVALQSNGKIVAASEDNHLGQSSRDPSVDFVVYRLNGDACADNDGDGYDVCSGDCDDNNPDVHPGVAETCNNRDDDCDGQVDEGLTTIYYRDSDGDGFGNPNNTIQACTLPAGYVINNTDCDDTKLLYVDNDGDGFGSGPPVACGVADNTDCNDANNTIHASITYYRDADGDGFGDPNTPTTVCQPTPPAGYVPNNQDCDDANKLYADGDGDGYGAGPAIPCGGALTNTDCNDNNPMVNPGVLVDICNDMDDDCDGLIDEDGSKITIYVDNDHDTWGNASQSIQSCAIPPGYAARAGDCNDGDPKIHPLAPETCNGIDDDCDGLIDEDAMQIFYFDFDGDGFGVLSNHVQACVKPPGYATQAGDCDDTDSAINPDATEVCNGIDDNCNNQIDEGTLITYYRDNDQDGFGNFNATKLVCPGGLPPAGYVLNSEDCNDSDPNIHPGETEICNRKDDNCDGRIDEGVTIPTWYRDVDGDGFGDQNSQLQSCTQPQGYVSNNSDCDDTNDTIYPNAREYCNGIDENCNGIIDDNPVLVTWYRDVDGDGWGDPNQTVQGCTPPPGYVRESFDCNDNDRNENPAAAEIDNGKDDNCDGKIDEDVLTTYYRDADNDTYGDPNNSIQATAAPAGYVTDNADCNDNNAAVHPGATEICNGIDDDCDGQIDNEAVIATWYLDADNDNYYTGPGLTQCNSPGTGYRSTGLAGGGDCDDNNENIHPEAKEICNGLDDNCDGQIDNESLIATWYLDADNDNYYTGSGLTRCNSPGTGYKTTGLIGGGDCDDDNATIHPGATESCNNIDDNCNGQIDEGVKFTFYRDADGDGFGDPNNIMQGCTPLAGFVNNNSDCDDSRLLYTDADGDGFGAGPPVACGVITNNDCNDGNAEINPNTTWYLDADNDNYYAGDGVTQCSSPGAGYKRVGLIAGGDCNDNNVNTNPAAAEQCDNGIDDNCDGQTDEACPVFPLLSINDVIVYESQRFAVLTVSLSRPAAEAIKINYKTIDGTAAKGKDFKNSNGSVTIEPGGLSAQIIITVIQDKNNEGPEYFDVQISLPKVTGQAQAVTMMDDAGRVTILNGVELITRASPKNLNESSNSSADQFEATITPNPTNTDFMLQIETNSVEATEVRVFDVQGRLVKHLRKSHTPLRFGSELIGGIYVVEVQQGTNKKILKVIKL